MGHLYPLSLNGEGGIINDSAQTNCPSGLRISSTMTIWSSHPDTHPGDCLLQRPHWLAALALALGFRALHLFTPPAMDLTLARTKIRLPQNRTKASMLGEEWAGKSLEEFMF